MEKYKRLRPGDTMRRDSKKYSMLPINTTVASQQPKGDKDGITN
jgi:hypothetical protein